MIGPIVAIILLKGSMLRFTSCKTFCGLRKNTCLKFKTTNHRGLFQPQAKLCNTWIAVGYTTLLTRLCFQCVFVSHRFFPHENMGLDLKTSEQHSQRSFLRQALGLSRVAVKGVVKGCEGLSSDNGLRNDWPSNNGCMEDLGKRFGSFWPPYFEPSKVPHLLS